VPVTCICRAKVRYSGVNERVTRLAACDQTSTRSALLVIAARMGWYLQPWVWLGIAKKPALNPPAQYCSPDAVCDGSLQRQLQLPAATTSFPPSQQMDLYPQILLSPLQLRGVFVPCREPLTWNASAEHFSRLLLATLAAYHLVLALCQETRNPGHEKEGGQAQTQAALKPEPSGGAAFCGL
jgi:hypothetical protein